MFPQDEEESRGWTPTTYSYWRRPELAHSRRKQGERSWVGGSVTSFILGWPSSPFGGCHHHWACCQWASPLSLPHYHSKGAYWVLPGGWAHSSGYGDEKTPTPNLKNPSSATQERCVNQTLCTNRGPSRMHEHHPGGCTQDIHFFSCLVFFSVLILIASIFGALSPLYFVFSMNNT